MLNKKIFISHCEKDDKIVKGFITMLTSLGLDQIFCSSSPPHQLSNEGNVYHYLKDNRQNPPYVLYVLSENYYADYACLNEMGAFWVSAKEEEQLALLVDDFDFSTLKNAIDPRPIGIKLSHLDCSQRIAQLVQALYDYFGVENAEIDLKKQKEINQFIQTFASLTEDSDGYFYSSILETRSTDYWPEAQFLKIEKNISHKNIEDNVFTGSESHWLVYLNGMDSPVSPSDYVKFKVTGKSKLCKDTNERRIYLSDIVIL